MIVIQKPRNEDTRGILEVFYKTWLSTYPNKEVGVTKEDIEDRFKDRLSEENIKKRTEQYTNVPENELYLIAKEGTLVVGTLKVVKREGFNQLQAIYVLPEYHGKGIGTMLWNKAEEFLGKDKNIIVQLATYNKQAESFYKKLGFVDTGKRFTDESTKMPISGVMIPEMEMILKHDKEK
jgi:ribosomal protein S18 acetylase RimI-like enzyme